MDKKQNNTILLVDGNALIHRGFHAMPHLSTKKGELTNGIYGFAQLFLTALKDIQPNYVAVSFDLDAPTFRDELYEDYKATREKAPDELYQQIPRVRELVKAFNVPVYEKEGFEADDVIGTLARQAKEQGLEVVILTGDYDTLQLVNEKVKVYAPKKGLGKTQIFDSKKVFEKYGLASSQLVDYKALRGDPSDNIPGVKGVGDKTATKLLQEFGSLEKVYEYLEDNPEGGEKIKKRFAKKLIDSKDFAFLSQKLAQIVTDVPVGLKKEKTKLADFDEDKVVELFQELEFKTLLKKIPKSENSTRLKEKIRTKNKDYHLVDSAEKYSNFVEKVKTKKKISVDTETTSIDIMWAELLGVGFSWKEGQAYYILEGLIDEKLKNILQSKDIKKIGHNLKYDYAVLKRAGINMQGIYFDTMIAAYLLNPGARNFNLSNLVFTELGYRMQPIEDLIGKKGKNQKHLGEIDVEKVSDYCCEDADMTWQLYGKLKTELEDKGLEDILDDIELHLVPVLSDMELAGIKLDADILKEISTQAEKEIEKLETEIYDHAGEKFNVGSPVQLREVLFDKLDIPANNVKKGKTGYSTAASELEKLKNQHPIIELIGEWRELSKLKNTYLDALPDLINDRTGRIHTSFNQTITSTGRLSSSDPNLQNIPIRTRMGKKVRRAFVAEKNKSLLSLDYSQIELRIGAHLSEDEKMLKVFKNDGDIHTATAMEVFEVKNESEVTPQQRRYAKVINFGIFYGLSPYGLTNRISEISHQQAGEFIDKFKSVYKGLTEYLERVIVETREKGYVENEIGRIRNLPEINSSQYQVRSGAERAAINMPLQSLAADIIKMAMNELAEKNLTNTDNCRLLLQVHDELLFEVESGKIEELAKKIGTIMEEVYELKVPIKVEAKAGKNWEQMDPFNLTN